jgi:hypothetical protein
VLSSDSETRQIATLKGSGWLCGTLSSAPSLKHHASFLGASVIRGMSLKASSVTISKSASMTSESVSLGSLIAGQS